MQFSGYDTNQLVKEAQNRWLKPAEVLFILQNHENHKLTETPPIKPHSGSLFLFNKRVLRFFRKDGHLWRRKKDGRTVGEAHERLKVGNVEALNCYYAHGEHNPNFQRRSFWMLDPAYEHIVLVHYREITEGKHGAGPSTLSSPSSSCISTQSPSLSNAQNPASTSAVSELYEPYQSSFSPGSVEVSSEFMIRNNGMDHLDGKIRSGDVNNSSGSEVSQALRRIEEQLSLNDDDREEFSLYYNQEEKLKDSGVLIYERTNHDGLAAVQRKEDDARYHRDADKLDDKNCNMFFQNSVHNRKQHQQLFGSEYRFERKDSPYWKEMLELCSGLTAIDSHEDIVNTSPDSEKPLFLERKENSVNLTDQTDNWTHQWLNFNGNDLESKKKYNATSENNLSLKAARQFLFGSDNPTVSPTSLSLSHGVENPGLTLYSSQTTNQANPEYYTMWFDHESQIGNLGSDSNLTLAQKQKFSIQTICPEWGYATENTKVIVAGSFLCDPSMCSWACMFGDIEVPVQIIQEGVFLCHAPPNTPGKVTLCITSGNKESCSEVREFEYLMKTSYDNSNSPQMTAAKSPEELLLIVRLAQMLLSDPMVQKENGVQSVFDVLRKPKRDDYLWECIIEELLVSSKTPIVVMDWLLQEFLKEKMLQWLSSKYNEGGMPGCSLSKKEQCIIHMVAGLGYEWALNPILHSGISVDFRDVNGWTALHWAARFGREKMVAALIAADASAGAVTDPTSQDPAGKTPGFIAAASGHKGLAGYLSELALTSHLSSLTLEESEISKGSAAVEAEKTVQNISKRSLGYCEDQLSLKDSLAAVRNAAQAAARIQSAFRFHSFRKRQVEEAARTRYDEYGLTEGNIDELFATSKLGFRNFRNHKLDKAALSIQKKYRGWKSRKDFLAVRQKVVRIQAHVRGHQVRKKYKVLWAVGVLDKVVLRWRRGGAGLRGFRPESESIDESEDEDILKVFRKQKVDVAIDDAFSRVLSMVESPEGRQQYRRMLGSYQEAKEELSSNVSAAASSCPGNNDDLANDIDECYMFP